MQLFGNGRHLLDPAHRFGLHPDAVIVDVSFVCHPVRQHLLRQQVLITLWGCAGFPGSLAGRPPLAHIARDICRSRSVSQNNMYLMLCVHVALRAYVCAQYSPPLSARVVPSVTAEPAAGMTPLRCSCAAWRVLAFYLGNGVVRLACRRLCLGAACRGASRRPRLSVCIAGGGMLASLPGGSGFRCPLCALCCDWLWCLRAHERSSRVLGSGVSVTSALSCRRAPTFLLLLNVWLPRQSFCERSVLVISTITFAERLWSLRVMA